MDIPSHPADFRIDTCLSASFTSISTASGSSSYMFSLKESVAFGSFCTVLPCIAAIYHRVFAHDEKVLYIDIGVCIYSCDVVAQGHLIRERELLEK